MLTCSLRILNHLKPSATNVTVSKKNNNSLYSQNFISTYRDDHCQYTYLHTFSYIKAYWQTQKYSRGRSKIRMMMTEVQRTTTSPILVFLWLASFPWDLGVRSRSLVNSVRRSVTSQMEEPEDDVTGVAPFVLAVLLVSFLVHEAGLVCGAAFCANGLTYYHKRICCTRSYMWVATMSVL